MRRHLLAPAVLFALALPLGCNASAEAPMRAADGAAPAVVDEAQAEAADDTAMADAPATRMVIRTARLEVRSDDLPEVAASLPALAEAMGGYVARSDATGVGEDLSRVEASLRVPSDRFDETLAKLRGEGEVLRESVEGQDVTEQYTDLQAQLRSQTALEERMLAILAKTEKVEDALAVERELVRVRSTIETLEGRRKLLEHQVAMATIDIVFLNPTQANAPRSETTLSRLDRAVDDAGDAFVGVIGALIRIFGGLLPLLIIGGPVVYATRKGLARRRARRQAQAAGAFVMPDQPRS